MRCFPQLVMAVCLITFLGTHTGIAGTRCGSEAGDVNRIWKETSADWWPSADLSDLVALVAPGSLSLLQWAEVACVPYGQAYLGQACIIHDQCYDGSAYPGASRQQCDQVLKDMWLEACNTQYPEHEAWEVWLEPRDWCREYCKETVKLMAYMQSTSSQAEAAWNAVAPERAANHIRTQCLQMPPPGGTCVLPAGDYPVVLTIDQPVALASAGGLVRIGVIE
jgi:hypothetical protein